ncbi:MAG: hypothetical protein JJE30_07930 [Desulfuromonadales bacterium]|nr:hypothetical protein [Desulfuromonadales bacterium]
MPILKRVICIILVVCGLTITGCGSGGESGLAAPTGMRAESGPGPGQVTISWAAVEGATSYNIYWSTNSGVTTANTKISGTSSPSIQTVTLRHNPNPYYFVVTAVNAGGESGTSTEVSAIPL